ncbi:hypothetical protein [Campylobacter pinnipediorum]|uniref:Uncharacterized protein n=1 Tax=Campylobacter pinnipediorum subsp. pinnipediorum TaxID=1660067 RepID=A0AAX0L9Q0_9BACT|nr:hypothetical protein [Campylobacter pinnipediorum]OPA77322.1 hypothetical protein BFG04_04300 [Campylobacter pinnipediorum subsp. pinnipediorum]OPA78249.1 hypothetical protein BFG05_03305 [Campylobacter pinnipediorum subsp. pinnipediorum]
MEIKTKLKHLKLETRTTLSSIMVISSIKINSLDKLDDFSDEMGIYNFTDFNNTYKAKLLKSKLKNNELLK